MERFICIHGHFYQPPRENPWLEEVEIQDSAYPYHDWNERITAECYAPNSASRILDPAGRIERIANNYSRISFNFGPTLLAWMEERAPDVYAAVLEADRESRKIFSGHGSALAQPYNHMIMPLASPRDRLTQVIWGVRDFEHRFQRMPEGMWLPETAVDLETLDILAQRGIRYTILAPHQAARVRRIGERPWTDVQGGRVDPTATYRVALPSGRSIAVFFYDGPISRAVAFERLLANGEQFARRLAGAFSDARPWPQFVHIATDGETYGHHHRHGDMALAYALHYVEANKLARLTNYGEFLATHAPTHEAEIFEETSWSCAHGMERWESNCGCNTGAHPGWSQAWREPLRHALDLLRDRTEPRFEHEARALLRDPWAARDEYISVILDRSPANVDRFLARHAVRPLDGPDRVRALKLLELQRHAMLMYTSCGWFFDDVSGIETVQVLQYAGRVLQLAQDVLGESLEPAVLKLLHRAKSNLPGIGDGAAVYERFVKPAVLDLPRVAAHYSVSLVFDGYAERSGVYCYTVQREDFRLQTAGRAKLAVGRLRVSSDVTGEWARLNFAVQYFGDHILTAGVREFQDEERYRTMAGELADAFGRVDLGEFHRAMERHFGPTTYSLRFLFRDEQRRILGQILASAMEEAEGVYRQFYEHHAPLMRFLRAQGVPVPKAFQTAAEFVLNRGLRRAIEAEEHDRTHIAALLESVRLDGVDLDATGLAYALKQTIDRVCEELRGRPGEVRLLQRLTGLVELAQSLPFEVDLWKPQNLVYGALQRGVASELVRALGARLSLRVPEVQTRR